MDFDKKILFLFLIFLFEVLCLDTYARPVEVKKCTKGYIDGISSYGVFNVEIVISDKFTDSCVYITAESNEVVSNIEADVYGNLFHILMANAVTTKLKTKIKFTLPFLSSYKNRGVSDTKIFFTALDSLNISLDGTQKVNLLGRLKELNIVSVGISYLYLDSVFSEKINLKNSGVVYLYSRDKGNISLHKNNIGIVKMLEN